MTPSLRRRAALYVRVSSDTQHTDSQKPDLLRLCRARDLDIVAVYEETISAVAQHREHFERMKLAAHRGEFEVLVVWALDRLGRSMTGNLQTVLGLDRVGVEVVSVREPWLDTSGPVRSLLIGVFSWVAEQERAQIIARTRAGLERARRQGKQIGRPRAQIDVATALTLRQGGASVRVIARQLKVGASTLHRALQAHDALAASTVPNPPGSTPQFDPHDLAAILDVDAA